MQLRKYFVNLFSFWQIKQHKAKHWAWGRHARTNISSAQMYKRLPFEINSFHKTQDLFAPPHFLNQPFPSHSPKNPTIKKLLLSLPLYPKQVCLCFSLGVVRDHTLSSPHTLLPSISSQQHLNTHWKPQQKQCLPKPPLKSHHTIWWALSVSAAKASACWEGFSLAAAVSVFSPPAPCSNLFLISWNTSHWKLWKRGFWFMMWGSALSKTDGIHSPSEAHRWEISNFIL